MNEYKLTSYGLSIVVVALLIVLIMIINQQDTIEVRPKLECPTHYITIERIDRRAISDGCRYEMKVHGFENFNGETSTRPLIVNGRCGEFSENDTLILK